MKAKHIYLVLVLFAFLPFGVIAQSGKIQGKVIDAETGDPLTGATVSIQGTTKGALVDIEGEYLMLNVAPGIYTLEARFLGYASIIVTEVIVRTDLTTTQDFSLSPEIYEGEEVVVMAEKPVIIKDLTSSEARVSSAEIEKLPVQEVTDIIQLQAGVSVDNSGGIHIRGGRTSEVSYIVNGVRVTDDYNRSQGLRIENQSIQELQVISGTFNAEYGQAMSGIINIVTKAGTNNFEGSANIWSGSYLVSKPEFYDGLASSITEIDPLRMYNGSVSFSGPIIKDKLTFFATARKFQNKGWLNGRNAYSARGPYTELLPVGTNPSNYINMYGEKIDLTKPWYSIDTVAIAGNERFRLSDSGLRDSSLVNMNHYDSYSFQGNLQLRLSNAIKFNLIGTYGNETGGSYNHQRRLVPGGIQDFYNKNYSLNLKTTVTPSARTFLSINTATTKSSYQSYLYKNPFDSRYFNYENIPIFGIEQPGQQYFFNEVGTDNSIFERSTTSYIAKAELSSQINDQHLVKAGVSFQYDEVFFENINLQPLSAEEGIVIPDYIPEDERQYIKLGIPPLETTNHSKFIRNPYNFAAFLQDKIEYENLIVNVGLRFDYFNANAQIPADSQDPDITNPTLEENAVLTREEREKFWYKDVDAKFQLSPRIGVAYPINEKGVIHFSYGYFFQMPTYEYLFTNSQILLPESSGVFGIYGNPDLKPERSTQYELGVKYEIFEGTGLEITGYYKDTRDYVSSGSILRTYNPSVRYATWINRDYSISRGLTVALNQRINQRFNFGLDYTYTSVEGSNSDPAAEFNLAVATGATAQTLVKYIRPLDWDRSHIINGSLFYAGNSWGGNLVGRFLTGTPYTPTTPFLVRMGPTASVRDLSNTERYPNRFTLDLNAYKDFQVSGTKIQIFLNIYNILDLEVINSIYPSSGSPDGPLIEPINYDSGYFIDPSRYDEPRRFQLGIQFSF